MKTALMSSAPNDIYMTTMAILSRNTAVPFRNHRA